MAIPRRNAPGVSLTRCCKCHGPGQVRRQEESASGLSRGFKKCKKPNTFRETLEIGRFLEKLGKFKNRLEILGKYGIISVLCRCSSSVEHQLPKLGRRVRFPSSAFKALRVQGFFCCPAIFYLSGTITGRPIRRGRAACYCL